MSIKNDEMYSLFDGDRRGAMRVDILDDSVEQESLFRNGSTHVVRFKQYEGKQLYDVVPSTFANIYLVSSKFRDLINKNGLTGIIFSRAEIQLKDGGVEESYYMLSISSDVGEIINSKSVLRTFPPIVPWGDEYKKYVGLFFDLATWDGSDFFTPKGTFYIFLTEHVRQIMIKENITNIALKPISELINNKI
ncbi:imm11 family protein [Echinicola sp. 20G]|uniref:imm11 family protein n=1 Tax=Echinicola sp. 20G TaxID=2781961 RepID=UPI00191115A2|nr:DUF1629 domain-containing protein [Echinicola sp. 20G]